MCVVDVLAPTIASGRPQDAPSASIKRPVQSVRTHLLELLKFSLLQGSFARGLRMHDIVRGYTRGLAESEPGGLRAMQRRAIEAVGAALEAPGGSESTSESTELLAWVIEHLPHHAAEAFVPEQPLLPDRLMAGLVMRHSSLEVRRAAAQALN